MKKTAVLLVVVCVFLVSASPLTVFEVEANPGPVNLSIRHGYIKSSGEVDPPSLPISRVGNTYTLTGDIMNYTLEIQRGNIVLDGAGYTLQGVYSLRYSGLTLSNVDYVAVKNLKINIFNEGFLLQNSNHITLTGNRVDASSCIVFQDVAALEVFDNTFFGKGYCILGQCRNSVFNYNYLDGEGIRIFGDNNRITNNYFENRITVAVSLGLNNLPCSETLVSGNTVTFGGDSGVAGLGIFFGSSDNNITQNRFIGSQTEFGASGVAITNSNNNAIYENNFENCKRSVRFDSYFQSMESTTESSISLNNQFYRNNFYNSLLPSVFGNNDSVNQWDNGLEGNFWSDYSGVDNDSDGLGDTPYRVGVNNTDNYPLAAPVEIQFSEDQPIPIAAPILLPEEHDPPATVTPHPTQESTPTATTPSPPASSTATPTESPQGTDFLQAHLLIIVLIVAGAVLAAVVAVFAKTRSACPNLPVA